MYLKMFAIFMNGGIATADRILKHKKNIKF